MKNKNLFFFFILEETNVFKKKKKSIMSSCTWSSITDLEYVNINDCLLVFKYVTGNGSFKIYARKLGYEEWDDDKSHIISYYEIRNTASLSMPDVQNIIKQLSDTDLPRKMFIKSIVRSEYLWNKYIPDAFQARMTLESRYWGNPCEREVIELFTKEALFAEDVYIDKHILFKFNEKTFHDAKSLSTYMIDKMEDMVELINKRREEEADLKRKKINKSLLYDDDNNANRGVIFDCSE